MRIGAMRMVAIGLGMALLVAACGDEGGDAGQGSAAAQPSPSAEASDAVGAGTVSLGDSDLGSILVDADGKTLYLFESDTDGSSTCYDDCATTWPPLIDEAPTAGDGADESLLGTTEREDGEMQVTYDGHPLYYFASDQAAGDTMGQGIGDVWFVVDASGRAVTDAGGRPGY
ncbi:MAG TPA: hypothetical protein VG993_08240 [Actinomycetota bacterium]|jgi:predicted lipoprotein with Yx(FWY)xxD motif|nr:hypothetical protein [Actinomycetota bacterium]